MQTRAAQANVSTAFLVNLLVKVRIFCCDFFWPKLFVYCKFNNKININNNHINKKLAHNKDPGED